MTAPPRWRMKPWSGAGTFGECGARCHLPALRRGWLRCHIESTSVAAGAVFETATGAPPALGFLSLPFELARPTLHIQRRSYL